MTAPHATPAAAFAALAAFLTEDGPNLLHVDINKNYDEVQRGPYLITWDAAIHVPEPSFPDWLDRHGIAETAVERVDRDDEHDTLTVTSGGVTIFCIADKLTDGGESA